MKTTLHLSVILVFTGSFSASAQIVPDTTLPNNSTVTVEGQINRITGGTTAGSNLFHSFTSFSLPTGTTAHFDNPLEIQNIFSRVTGSSISNIDGLIQANGSANLFLINPNGILFGPNARLNIGGSFLASTANSIVFNDGSLFSAKNPQAPPLLTVNVPIGLQFGSNPGSITVQGQGLNQPATEGEPLAEIAFQQSVLESSIGLGVQPARTLALVGGNITFSGGLLKAPAGRIELGSVGDNSNVSLTPTGTGFTLGYETVATFKDIQLSRQSAVFASGEGGGDIQLAGRRIQLSEGSQIQASTLGAQPGGNVTVRATESIEITGTSADGITPSGFVAGTFSSGNAGNMTIETDQLILRDSAQVGVATASAGDAGNLTIRATDQVEITGTSADQEEISGLAAGTYGNGDAGDVIIETRQIILRNGGQVAAATLGEGNAGNLSIRATDRVEIIGASADGETASSLATGTNGTGNAGSLSIETRQLSVRDGAIISAATASEGKGGNLSIRATDVEIIGTSGDGTRSSALQAATGGSGNAGNLTIETANLTIRDGGVASAATFGSGQGGNLAVRATEAVEITGTSPDGKRPSSLAGQTFGSGNAGNINLETRRLTLQDGAQIQLGAEIGTTGKAGNLTIRATERIDITGTSSDGETASGLVAGTGGIGNAGDVNIETAQLTMQNGAQVVIGTTGEGNAGNLSLYATDSVEISSSGILAGTLGLGDAGNATIETGQLTLRDGGLIFIGAFPATEGQGGNLTVRATDSVELSGTSADGSASSGLLAYTFGFGDAGDITIETRQLMLRDGAQVSVGAVSIASSSNAQAGNVTIRATDSVELTGTLPNGQSASGLSAATNTAGDAGDVIIETERLIIGDGAEITVNGLASGNPGSIEITSGDVRLFNQGKLTATSATGKGGNIDVRANNIQLRRNSEISATGSQTGNLTTEGNITIEPVTLVLLEGSRIITNASDPAGGSNITINPFAGSDLAVFKSPNSIINAVGDLTIQGNVSVQPADVPEVEVTNIEGLISAGCQDIAGSEFIVTGRGGLPPNPSAPLNSNNALVEWATPDAGGDQLSKQPSQFTSTTRTPLIEAQGWIIAADGTITLTAQAPTATPHHLGFTHPTCKNYD